MTDQRKLAAQLATLLELPPDATESAITARVSAWAAERKHQKDNAAFERRVADLIAVTNMPGPMARQTLAAQDAAARATQQNA
jgi:hypothetical protein